MNYDQREALRHPSRQLFSNRESEIDLTIEALQARLLGFSTKEKEYHAREKTNSTKHL